MRVHACMSACVLFAYENVRCCMHKYMRVCMCVLVCVCAHVRACVCMCIHAYMCARVCACMHKHQCACACDCMCRCMCLSFVACALHMLLCVCFTFIVRTGHFPYLCCSFSFLRGSCVYICVYISVSRMRQVCATFVYAAQDLSFKS